MGPCRHAISSEKGMFSVLAHVFLAPIARRQGRVRSLEFGSHGICAIAFVLRTSRPAAAPTAIGIEAAAEVVQGRMAVLQLLLLFVHIW